jgi:prepilin-type N-terminal cleavage/methylation domain-containing protein
MAYRVSKKHHSAFTLAELLIALVVTSIVLAAVATLTFALGTMDDDSNDTAATQARLRCAGLRISELIRNCKLICGTSGSDMALWKADGNGDRKINPGELVYIECGADKDRIRFLDFSPRSGWFAENWFKTQSFKISEIRSGQAKIDLWFWCKWNYTTLIQQCSNVRFLLDTPAPQTRFVSISFDLAQDGVAHRYQINAALRAWAGNLLNSSGEIVKTDDD